MTTALLLGTKSLLSLYRSPSSISHLTKYPRRSCLPISPYHHRKWFNMVSNTARPIFIVAGVGSGAGTGAATAKLFAKEGYHVALIARNADHLKKTSDEINAAGGESAPFPIDAYDPVSLNSAFNSIASRWPESQLRAALWNVGHGIWKPFLQITDEEVGEMLNTTVRASFAFSRLVINKFKENDINEAGKRGTLIFQGATAALRGNSTTSIFAAGKFGTRALSQSLNKEFGKDNIHVAHSIIDGVILTDHSREWREDTSWEANEDARLNPGSIAKSYLYLTNQDRSAWTWELDLRPAHETW